MPLIKLPTLLTGFAKGFSAEAVNEIGQLAGGEFKADFNYVPSMNDYNASDLALSCTALADSEFTTAWRAWYAFRGNGQAGGIGWIGSVNDTGFLRITFNTPVVLSKLVMTSINDGNFGRSPKDFTIWGDGNLLGTLTGITWTQNETKLFAFTNFTRYTSYEIRITAIQVPGNAPGIGLMDWRNIFDNTSPVFSLINPLAIGALIEQLPLIERNDIGTSIAYDYEFNAGGLITGLTLAQLDTAWVGNLPDELTQFIIHMNSNGLGSPRINLNGGVISGGIIAAASPLFGGGVLSA